VGGEVFLTFTVTMDAFADGAGEVQLFELIDDAEGLLVMAELGDLAAVSLEGGIEGFFADMAEGGVADVMGEGDGFDEVFIQAEGAADGAGDLGDFEGVGEAGSVVIAGGDEDLGFVLEPAEGFAVEDAVPVALEAGSDGVGIDGVGADIAFVREGGERG